MTLNFTRLVKLTLLAACFVGDLIIQPTRTGEVILQYAEHAHELTLEFAREDNRR